jgi:hypothetical protein
MKLLFLPLAVGSLVVGGSPSCFARQPTSPVTLERLLDSKAAETPAATAEADAGPQRPAGTAMRPKDSVQHPDLDKAWKAYKAAVEKVGQSIRAVMKSSLTRLPPKETWTLPRNSRTYRQDSRSRVSCQMIRTWNPPEIRP